MGLKEYKAKRNFSRTREPAGKVHGATPIREGMFVVQKHDATRLHYDFRLEMGGVLKSWAVPKGFPTRKGDRRLAVEVEDHPIEYGDFEGTIPEGNYGAGTVMLWDTGTYSTDEGDPPRDLERGKLHLTLRGKKLKGEWTLVRMRAREQEAKPQWLLLKSGEDVPSISAQVDDRSVQTKRSMALIASANDKQWQSNRGADTKLSAPEARSARIRRRSSAKSSASPASSPKAQQEDDTPGKPNDLTAKVKLTNLPKAQPEFVEPMKALLVKTLPRGSDWIYELKFDGVRALAIRRKDEITLISRTAKDLGTKYHEVAEALPQLGAKEFVLDGEVVAMDEEGRSSFQLLQSYQIPDGPKPALRYYVFDLINLNGRDTRDLPLHQRKALAEALLAEGPETIRFSSSLRAASDKVMRAMQARGLEGLIAKRKDSKYESGRRSGAWVKFKWTNEQEFVIGGYTKPKGTRSHFGALLVGYYEKRKLMFAAKVGTGFDQKTLSLLHAKFQKLVQPDCPFANLPEKPRSGRNQGLTAREMRFCTWLEPKLVCQVRFAEWTRDHHLRQPAFLGLREDKNPKEVVREQAQ
jgi:bifunctional non-homologous end joining protein LigD